MAIGLFVFAMIFLMRDAQTLVMQERARVAARLAVYFALQAGAIALMADLCKTWPGISNAWTDRRFALAAVLVQLAEVGIAFALRRFATGKFCWVGYILPSPVLLIALFGLSFALQDGLLLSPGTAIQMVTLSWLSLVFVAVILPNRMDCESDDANFTGDFALLT